MLSSVVKGGIGARMEVEDLVKVIIQYNGSVSVKCLDLGLLQSIINTKIVIDCKVEKKMESTTRFSDAEEDGASRRKMPRIVIAYQIKFNRLTNANF